MMWDRAWDEIFSGKEWGRYPPEDLVRFIARNFFGVSDRRRIRILEIGCGPAANLSFLAKEGFQAHGLDGSHVALRKALEWLSVEGREVALVRGEAMHLPYPDEFFDCVLDIECLYANTHLDACNIVAEVRRVLKSRGVFFSKTFMTGVTGQDTGTALEGEPHTFTSIPDGPFNQGYSPIRLVAEDEIPILYSGFSSLEYDYLIRSTGNRNKIVKEWLITCRK